MEKTVQEGGKNSFIFLSSSQGKTDPLDYATKSEFIKKMHPKLADYIVDDAVQGPIYAANWLYDRGFRNLAFVAGSDRLGKGSGSLEKLLTSWNSGPVRTTDAARGDEGREHVNLTFISSGQRDPDAGDITGYSGTKARAAAEAGNEAEFWKYTGASPDLKVGAVDLYQATRAGLGIKDQPAQEEDMQNLLDHKDVILASIAKHKGMVWNSNTGLTDPANNQDITDQNLIAKKLLGQTATAKQLVDSNSIIEYIIRLPNYDQLVEHARKQNVHLPVKNQLKSLPEGSIGWFRLLIEKI